MNESKRELWKSIKGYEGWYIVSNFGRIKRVAAGKGTRIGRFIKPRIDSNGYKRVGLSKNGIIKDKFIHRLVAEAFLDISYNKTQVNHKDLNPGNNYISNLEYTTRKENTIHAWKNKCWRHKLPNNKGDNHPQRILNSRKVLRIKMLCDKKTITHSQLAIMYGVSKSLIDKISETKIWKSILMVPM